MKMAGMTLVTDFHCGDVKADITGLYRRFALCATQRPSAERQGLFLCLTGTYSSARKRASETYRAIIVRPWRDWSIADESLTYFSSEWRKQTRHPALRRVSPFFVQGRRDTKARIRRVRFRSFIPGLAAHSGWRFVAPRFCAAQLNWRAAGLHGHFALRYAARGPAAQGELVPWHLSFAWMQSWSLRDGNLVFWAIQSAVTDLDAAMLRLYVECNVKRWIVGGQGFVLLKKNNGNLVFWAIQSAVTDLDAAMLRLYVECNVKRWIVGGQGFVLLKKNNGNLVFWAIQSAWRI
jgi:hypothetical protein